MYAVVADLPHPVRIDNDAVKSAIFPRLLTTTEGSAVRRRRRSCRGHPAAPECRTGAMLEPSLAYEFIGDLGTEIGLRQRPPGALTAGQIHFRALRIGWPAQMRGIACFNCALLSITQAMYFTISRLTPGGLGYRARRGAVSNRDISVPADRPVLPFITPRCRVRGSGRCGPDRSPSRPAGRSHARRRAWC